MITINVYTVDPKRNSDNLPVFGFIGYIKY